MIPEEAPVMTTVDSSAFVIDRFQFCHAYEHFQSDGALAYLAVI